MNNCKCKECEEKNDNICLVKMLKDRLTDAEEKIKLNDFRSPSIFVPGDIIKLKCNDRFNLWQITGVHLASVGYEDLISLKTLSNDPGSAYGTIVTESLVPLDFLQFCSALKRI